MGREKSHPFNLEFVMTTEELVKSADLNWCVDILKRIESITNRFPSTQNGYAVIDYSDIDQIKYLVKMGLKVVKEDE